MVFTRLGDGSILNATVDQIRTDIEAGTLDAAERASIPTLSEDELARLHEIICRPGKFVGVEKGNRTVGKENRCGYLRIKCNRRCQQSTKNFAGKKVFILILNRL